ncbi:MAG: TonB-dependent receptor plug domain-containing protein [Bdellovibrionales bacterium]
MIFLLSFLIGLSAHAASDNSTTDDLPESSIDPIAVGRPFGLLGTVPDKAVKILDSNPAQAMGLDEALDQEPGLVVLRSGGPGQLTSLFIRGASSQHTLILFDGMDLNDPGLLSSGIDLSTLDLTGIEKVEIFKGPSSLRFGPGALGGVINLVSRKAPREGTATAQVRAGGPNTHQESISVGRSGMLDWNISLSRFESDGISAAKGHPEQDGTRSHSGYIKIGRAIDAKSRIDFTSQNRSSYTELDYATAPSPLFTSADDPNYYVERFGTANTLAYERNWNLHWQSSFNVGHHYQQAIFVNSPDSGNSNDTREEKYSDSTKFNNINVYNLSPSTTFVFGPQYRVERSGHSARTWGVFGEVGQQIGNAHLGAGLRHDDHSVYGSEWSPAASASYSWLNLGLDTEFNVGRSFKSPSLYQLYDPTSGDENLLPEYVTSYELELRWKIANLPKVRVTWFRYDFRDLIDYSTRYKNLKEARNTGVETELSDKLQNFKWSAGYTYLDARDLSTGLQLTRRPYHSWNAGLGFESGRSTFGLRYHGLGRRPDVDAISGASLEVDSYDVVDVQYQFEWNQYVLLSASLENALDRDYEAVSGYGVPGRFLYIGARFSL